MFFVETTAIRRSRSTLLFEKKFNLYCTITTIKTFQQSRSPMVVHVDPFTMISFIVIFLIQHNHIQSLFVVKYVFFNIKAINTIEIKECKQDTHRYVNLSGVWVPWLHSRLYELCCTKQSINVINGKANIDNGKSQCEYYTCKTCDNLWMTYVLDSI